LKSIKFLLLNAVLVTAFILAPTIMWADGFDEPPHGTSGGGGSVPPPGGGSIQETNEDVEGDETEEWMTFEELWIFLEMAFEEIP
jgi:hypothetical protein